MTNEELLAKIDEPDHWFKPFLDMRQALRAVVELHKPFHDQVLDCVQCKVEFPCPTIQAIEKELV